MTPKENDQGTTELCPTREQLFRDDWDKQAAKIIKLCDFTLGWGCGFDAASLSAPSAPQKCPTCGSDRPTDRGVVETDSVGGAGRVNLHRDRKWCDDPFHPAPSEPVRELVEALRKLMKAVEPELTGPPKNVSKSSWARQWAEAERVLARYQK